MVNVLLHMTVCLAFKCFYASSLTERASLQQFVGSFCSLYNACRRTCFTIGAFIMMSSRRSFTENRLFPICSKKDIV